MSEKHLFALFYKNLSNLLSYNSDGAVEIRDSELWHRMTHVLRLRAGQEITLFDGAVSAQVVVLEQTFKKKEVVFASIINTENCKALKPHIILMPCLLKKDAFEDIIYAAAQMGVNKIVPVLSDKTHRPWGDKKEHERLVSVMIAACEQSKNFVLPQLCDPVKISDVAACLPNKNTLKVYFDPAGSSFVDLLKKIEVDLLSEIGLFFGPEGGLTGEEERKLIESGFETYALTPTILRTREAAIVGIGGVRSVR